MPEMSDDKAALKTLLAELDEGLQRMAKTFKQIDSGDRERFVRLGKVARSMQRSVREFRAHLDPTVATLKAKGAEDDEP
jgi:hypothetical protein